MFLTDRYSGTFSDDYHCYCVMVQNVNAGKVERWEWYSCPVHFPEDILEGRTIHCKFPSAFK